MPFTRSNKAIAAIQRLAVDLADKIYELAHYLAGPLPHLPYLWWLNKLRWILEETRELCQANSSEMSYATENILRAVLKAMQLTGNLIHNDDLHGLHGNNLQHAEELHDVLKDAVANLMEIQRKMKDEDGSVAGEEKSDNGEDAPASKNMRLT